MDECRVTDIPILTKYLAFADTVSWLQTRELMLSVLRPYLKKIWLADRDGGSVADQSSEVGHTGNPELQA